MGPASSAGELEPEERRDEDLPADLEPRREDWSQAPLPADLEPRREDWSEVPMPGEPDPTATAPDPSRDPAGAERDRRTESRRIFSSKVVAQANDRSRVLIARDLALGGMRTDPDPALAVGDELTIALPLVVGHAPLVIKARVIRDDADWGLVLQFRDLSEEAAAFLRRKSSFLPICDSPFEEEESAGVIVSEILACGTG